MLKRSPRRSDDGKTCVSESNGPLDEVLVGGDTRTPRTKSLALSLRGCPPSATNSAMAFGQQWGSKLPTRALHPGLGKKFYHLLTSSPNKRVTRANGIHKVEHSKYCISIHRHLLHLFDLIWFYLGTIAEIHYCLGQFPLCPSICTRSRMPSPQHQWCHLRSNQYCETEPAAGSRICCRHRVLWCS